MNNLLERLHASFFFFLLVRPEIFMKIGMYLPSVILVGTAMLFSGLGEWVNAGWLLTSAFSEGDEKSQNAQPPLTEKWIRRDRPVLDAVMVMISTHAVGYVLFEAVSRRLVSPSEPTWLCAIELTWVAGPSIYSLFAVRSNSFTSCTLASTNPSWQCTGVRRSEGTKLVLYLGGHLYHCRAQLLTCYGSRRLHGHPAHLRIPFIQPLRSPNEVHRLLYPRPGLAGFLPRRDPESTVELGGA